MRCARLAMMAVLASVVQAFSGPFEQLATTEKTLVSNTAMCTEDATSLRVSQSDADSTTSLLLSFPLADIKSRSEPYMNTAQLKLTPANSVGTNAGIITLEVVTTDSDDVCGYSAIEGYPTRSVAGDTSDVSADFSADVDDIVQTAIAGGAEVVTFKITPTDPSFSVSLMFKEISEGAAAGPRIEYTMSAFEVLPAKLNITADEKAYVGTPYVFRAMVPLRILANGAEVDGRTLNSSELEATLNVGNVDGAELTGVVSALEGEDGDYAVWTFTYTPLNAGMMYVAVSMFGTMVDDAPTLVEVFSAPALPTESSATITSPGLYFIPGGNETRPVVGVPFCFNVTLRDYLQNKVNQSEIVTVFLEVAPTEKAATNYTVVPYDQDVYIGEMSYCFTPNGGRSGIIHATIEGTEIAGFPVTVDIMPGEMVLEETSLELPISPSFVAGANITVNITANDLGGGATTLDDSLITLNYTKLQGSALIDIAIRQFDADQDGNVAYEEVLSFERKHRWTPEMTQEEFNEYDTNADGLLSYAEVAIAMGAHDLDHISSSVNASIASSIIVDDYNNTALSGATVTLNLEDVGLYTITFMYNGTQFFDTNITITPAPATHALVDLKTLVNATTGGMPLKFDVIAFDEYFNPCETGGLEFEMDPAANVTDGKVLVSSSQLDYGNGTYYMNWMTTVTGSYDLVINGSLTTGVSPHAVVSPVEVSPYPWSIEVVPAAFSALVSGPIEDVNSTIVAGEPPSITIQERDQFGNPLQYVPDNLTIVALWTKTDGGSGVPVTVGVSEASGATHPIDLGPYCTVVGSYSLRVIAMNTTTEPEVNMTVYAKSFEIVNNVPSPKMSAVVYPNDLSTDIPSDTEVTLDLYMNDEFENPALVSLEKSLITVDVAHGGQASLAHSVSLIADAHFNIKFTPLKVGMYSIFVYYDGKLFRQKPLKFRVTPSDCFGPFSFVQGTARHSAVAGNLEHILVQMRDISNNDCRGADGSAAAFIEHVGDDGSPTQSGTVHLHFEPSGDPLTSGVVSGTYNATQAGNYLLFVRVLSNSLVMDARGSPYGLVVYPSKTKYTDLKIPDGASQIGIVTTSPVAGVPFSFNISAYDRFDNHRHVGGERIKVSFVGEGENITYHHEWKEYNPYHNYSEPVFDSRVTDNGDGTYTVTGIITRTGKYLIDAGDLMVSNETEFTVVAGPSSAEHAAMNGDGFTKAVAGVTTYVDVKLFDTYGNQAVKGGDLLKAEINPRTGGSAMSTAPTIPVNVQDFGNGTYLLSYVTEHVGEYDFEITLSDSLGNVTNIKGSPSILTVYPGETSVTSSVLRASSLSMRAGISTTFHLQTFDNFGNLRKTGNETVRMALVGYMGGEFENRTIDDHNGNYSLVVSPTIAGTYPVSIYINDVLLQNNAMSLEVLPGPTHPLYCQADLTKLAAQVLEAGVKYSFEVATADLYGNPTVEAQGAVSITIKSDHHIVYGNFSPTENSTLTVYEAGPEIQVSVFLGSDIVPGSPELLKVVGSETSTLRSTANGTGLVEGVAGELAPFVIAPTDKFGNPSSKGTVSVEVLDPDDVSISLNYTELKDTYEIFYEPTLSGTYTISLKVGEAHLVGSPYTPTIVPGPTDPKSCLVYGKGVQAAQAGKKASFIVVSKDAYGNPRGVPGDHVSVFGFNVRGVIRVMHFEIVDTTKGVYHVSYTAPTAGDGLVLEVHINGALGGGRNFSVPLSDLAAPGCPNNCSSHGVCDLATDACVCDDGWRLSDCSERYMMCPSNCSFNGTLRGVCNETDGVCECFDGFDGDGCECEGECPDAATPTPIPSACLYDCSGNGQCISEDVCRCDPGHYGRGCENTTTYSYHTVEDEFGYATAFLYEVNSGRIFGYKLTKENMTCAGLTAFEDSDPQLYRTSFFQLPKLSSIVHVGEGRFLALDRVFNNASLVSFDAALLRTGSYGVPSVVTVNLPVNASEIAVDDLQYLGDNRLLVGTPEDASVYVIDRQSDEIILEQASDLTWTRSHPSTGHYLAVASDLIGRYSYQGKYEIFKYDRPKEKITEPPLVSQFLTHMSVLNTASPSVFSFMSNELFVAVSMESLKYNVYSCPTDGFYNSVDSACHFLNSGSMLTGFSCPAIDVNAACTGLSASACLKSDSCGLCVMENSKACVAGSVNGQSAGTCPGQYAYTTVPMAHEFGYMGQNKMLDLEVTSGTYAMWNMYPKGESKSTCPALSGVDARGSLPDAVGHSFAFHVEGYVDLKPATGELIAFACDLPASTTTSHLACTTWASTQEDSLMNKKMVFLTESSFLSYDARDGSYEIWEMCAMSAFENDECNLLKSRLAEGQMDELKDMRLSVISSGFILGRDPVMGTTKFLTYESASATISMVYEDTTDSLVVAATETGYAVKQVAYASMGSEVLLEYDSSGNWRVLDCYSYPVSGDVFKPSAPMHCYPRSAGTQLPLCGTYDDAADCVANPACGYCATDDTCYTGAAEGPCSSTSSCAAEDWSFVGTSNTTEVETTEEDDCTTKLACKSCVVDDKCGWDANASKCMAGTPAGPSGHGKEGTVESEDWNYYFCTGDDSCGSFDSCDLCAGTQYCGWCPSTNTCLVSSDTGPLGGACPGTSVLRDATKCTAGRAVR